MANKTEDMRAYQRAYRAANKAKMADYQHKYWAQKHAASKGDTYSINAASTAAVANDYYLQPMRTCPVGVKVQLENPGGVLVYGTYDGKSTDWLSWAPCPKRKKEEACATSPSQ